MDGEQQRHPLLAGRYRLIDQLGSGGMGVVWRAVDELLDREVAAKEVRAPDHMREQDVRTLYARLKQEARAAARISHPNVITVHDVVEQEGRPWIVMEFVRGRSLAEILQHEGVLSPKEAAKVGSMVLQALRSAHSCGVLHRDVKPANVLMEPGGRVVLTDFGIALVEGSGTLTRTGDLVGSPDYLAPERALGERPGTPSDLWSLGATLYSAVEGVSPFRRTSALSTLQAVVQDDPPTPRRAGPLTPLLEGLLRKDPQTRMGSTEAQRLLDAVASGQLLTQPDWSRPEPAGYVPTAASTPTTPPPPPAPGLATGSGSGYAPPSYGSPPPPGTPPGMHGMHGPGGVPGAPGAPTSTAGASVRGPAGPVGSVGRPTGYPMAAHGAVQAPFPTPMPTPTPSPIPGPAPGTAPPPRRGWPVYLGPLLALLLIAGGTVAGVLSAGGPGDSGKPGGGPTGTVQPSESRQPDESGSPGASDEPRPSPSGHATDRPASPDYPTTEPTRNPGRTCNGGWVTQCATR
ncbi:serine/threonine-protein kinase [Streptomyces sp. VNUA116]|uniref:serine/threonine-protein kinase n=1 Tax=Streptomyces sp. VNUA116 TaxID=3062449 RepID=UPI0026757311|nr:serine/threonine-protein kinase [Streptomyces sp. VNUA116]WKU48183.1 serine/threonine-protein kinase [Streptomyces sp. VNUA116]